MDLSLDDVFAVMRGDKPIRDVTNPAVADAVTGQQGASSPSLNNVFDTMSDYEQRTQPQSDLGFTASLPDDGGVALTDESGARSLAQSRQSGGSDLERQRLELQQYRHQVFLQIQQAKTQLKSTPPSLKSAPTEGSAPLSYDPDILKNTAFKFTAGVSGQDNKQAFYSAHSMLTGEKQFDADEYTKVRGVLERQAQSGNKGARYYLNEFDAFFARKASEFIPSAMLAASRANDTREMQTLIFSALSDVFDGNDALQESFLRNGGTEMLLNVMKQAQNLTANNMEAEKHILEVQNAKATIAAKGSKAASALRGQSTFAQGGSFVYDQSMTEEDREVTKQNINAYYPGGGDKVEAMTDFAQHHLENSRPNAQTAVLSDIDSTLDAVIGRQFATREEFEDALITEYNRTAIDPIEPGDTKARADFFWNVARFEYGAKSFGVYAQGIVDTANARKQQADIVLMEQWAELDSDTGTAEDLSNTLKSRSAEYYAGFYDKAVGAVQMEARLEGAPTGGIDEEARIRATRDILLDVSQGNGDYLLPSSSEELEQADTRIKEIYGMVGGRLDDVDVTRKSSQDMRVHLANMEWESKHSGEQRTVEWTYIENGENDFIAPQFVYDKLIKPADTSKDPKAMEFVTDYVVNGEFDVQAFAQANPNFKRFADAQVDIDGQDGTRTEKMRDYLRTASDEVYTAYTNPDLYLAGTLNAESVQEQNEGMAEINKLVTSIMEALSAKAVKAVQIRDYELENLSNPQLESVRGSLKKHAEPLLEIYNSNSAPSIRAKDLIRTQDEDNIKRGIALMVAELKSINENHVGGKMVSLNNSFAEYYGKTGTLKTSEQEQYFERFKRDMLTIRDEAQQLQEGLKITYISPRHARRGEGTISSAVSARRLEDLHELSTSYRNYIEGEVGKRYKAARAQYKNVSAYINLDPDTFEKFVSNMNEVLILRALAEQMVEATNPSNIKKDIRY